MKLESVWSAYQTSLRAFLLKNVNNPSDVEELLQDILLKTYLNFNQIKDANKIKSWLFQVANRSMINHYRQQGKSAELADVQRWNEQDEKSIFSQLSHCILPFINALPMEQAELLNAIEIEGISQKEYAESNGIKYSTLKSRVKKSRENLLLLFNSCCEFSIDKQGSLMDFTKKGNNCIRC